MRLEQNGQSREFTAFQKNQVKTASERLHVRLSPLANPQWDEQDRRLQLEAIVGKIAQLGTILLLQPATYEFEWSSRLKYVSASGSSDDYPRSKSKWDWRFITFPALLKRSDNNGRQLEKPQLFCAPEYLDGDDIAE